ncbi:hypothetical protein ZPAH1_orf00190 [Aeromonas phage ZPAH1]|nr:hypothetical protein ZPAH1_orf00190 [Aeromonas phage ZPAH1]
MHNMRFRFKSENHKQEFINYGEILESGDLGNKKVVDFLDKEGIDTFYLVSADIWDTGTEFVISIDGEPQEIDGLIYHFSADEVEQFLSVV